MTHDRNTQTTNSNNNIIKLDNEQALQDITGGGLGCLGVTVLSGLEGAAKLRKSQRTNDVRKCAQAIDHLNLAKDASRTALPSPPICSKCPENVIKYVALKIT